MSAAQVGKGPVQALVHFNGLPANEQRTLLHQCGGTLLDYILDNTFSALLQFPLSKEKLLSLPMQSIINTQPEMEADDYLWHKINGQRGGVLVSFFRNISDGAIRQNNIKTSKNFLPCSAISLSYTATVLSCKSLLLFSTTCPIFMG